MRNNRLTKVAVPLLALACCLSACSQGGSGGGGGGGGGGGNDLTGGLKGAPIPVSFVNVTSDPQGNSQPDAWDGARAAEAYVNGTLGGLNGRPIKLTQCNVTNSPDTGTKCANDLLSTNPVAVISGINIVADQYMPALKNAGVPYITSSPLSASEFTSPNSFLMSGGTAASGPAFALYATNKLHAKKIAVGYVDQPPAQAAASNFMQKPLEAHGVSVSLVPVPVQAPDMAPYVSALLQGNPDVVYILTPDPQCIGVFKALQAVHTKVPFFYAGNCASQSDMNSAGGASAVEGANFATSPGSAPDPGNKHWAAYAKAMKDNFPKTSLAGNAVSGFNSVMDTYTMMKSVKGDLTPASLMAAFKAASNVPPWFGSQGITCDGKQFPGLTAICSTETEVDTYKNGKLTKLQEIPSVLPLFGQG